MLYRCALSEDVHMSNHQEPRCVLLRLYGPAHGDTDIQLEIFRRLADEKLGPKLYAYFEGGRLEEYLPSSPLAWNDMTRYDVSAVIAGKIASIHRLEFECLEGSSDWLLRMYRELNDFILSARESSLPFEKFVQESTKILALDMMRINFSSEINYLSALLQASRAPLVFSHNDLHQNNVIMLHKSEKDETLDDRIVLIDFEYCSYNYRTFDIANHLSEWCFDYNGDEYPHFTASIERFPSEEKQRQFLKHYIKELESDNRGAGLDKDPTFYDGENSLNDKIEILFDEMQPCMMASNLLWAMWAIKSACTSKIKFGYWVSNRLDRPPFLFNKYH